MLSTPRHLRRPLIALVAIFAASFAASDASACSTMEQGQGACATACGCCTSGGNEAPTARAEAAAPATLPQVPGLGRTAPAENCSCRSQEPAAPSPKPARSTAESRPELSDGSVFVQLGEAFARTALAPQVPATQSPPKAPLYLQNARLLF
jgi:hypothetical protein